MQHQVARLHLGSHEEHFEGTPRIPQPPGVMVFLSPPQSWAQHRGLPHNVPSPGPAQTLLCSPVTELSSCSLQQDPSPPRLL